MGLNSTHQDDGDDDDSLASDGTGSVLNGTGKWQRHACLHKAISSIDVSSTHIPAANLMMLYEPCPVTFRRAGSDQLIAATG